MSGVAVFNSAVRQLQNQQQNLLKIREARKKMEAEEEDRAFQKKERELKLEKMRREGQMSELEMDAFRSQQKAYDKQQDDIAKGWNGQIKLAEHQAKTMADEAMNWAKIAYKSDPQGVTSFLQATHRNQNRNQIIVPKMSYGKIGYDVEDVDQPDPEKPEYTRKDVVSQAQRMAGNGMTPTDEHLARAEELLSGKPAIKPAMATSSESITKKFKNSKTGKLESFQKKDGKWVKI